MPLTKRELQTLLEQVGRTRESEIDCGRCLADMAEFAERELAGKPISEVLDAVRHHLSVCAECREEYELLQRALQTLES